MRYLNSNEIKTINKMVLKNRPSLIINEGLLDSAISRPKQTMFGSDLYQTKFEKCAALFHSLIMNHCFQDGNKRTAFISMAMFIKMNGLRANWSTSQAETFVLSVVTQHWNIDKIANWIQEYTR